MATIHTDGSLSLLSGSTAEGQTYARHLANQNIQDIDILLHCGSVNSVRNLIPTRIPGFVRIKFDDQTKESGSTQFIGEKDVNGILCINGCKLKEKHCRTETSIGAPLSYVTLEGPTSPDASSAAVPQKVDYKTIDLGQQFRQALLNISNQRDQLGFNTIKTNYVLFSRGVCEAISQYALPLCCTTYTAQMFQEQNVNEQIFRDLFTLVGPAYDYDLPQVTRVRITSLLDFYNKYKQVGNPKAITDMADYFKSCAPVDADFVPALQLKFWPDDIQPFLERIKRSRPEIYESIINQTSMHVIQKWSTKTPGCDRELEFRYSFSAVELLLAQKRSFNEQILNGIARSVYYKFLKDQRASHQNVIPSYFIKTTVLWMCETMDLNDDNPKTLAEKWLKYATDLLNTGDCPHYFIKDLNILEPFTKESLDKAREILLNVQVDDIHQIKMYMASGQKSARDKYNQNVAYFLSSLKVSDMLEALHDYRQLKQNWLSLNTDLVIEDDEIDMAAALTILNTLRALDGNYDNWKTFRKIFLECTPSSPPIWGETVNTDSVTDCAESLLSISVILTFMSDNISSTNILSEQRPICNMEDFQNYQNVIHQYLDHKTLYASIQASYSYFYNQSVSAFEQRNLIDYHPYGPQVVCTANERDRGFHQLVLDLCRNTSDKNLTLRELYQQQPQLMNNTDDDEQLALAIQRSLDDVKQ